MNNFICIAITLVILTCSGASYAQSQKRHINSIQRERIILCPEDSELNKKFYIKNFYQQDSAIIEADDQLFFHYFSKIIGLPWLSDSVSGEHLRIWNWDFKNKFVIDISNDLHRNKCQIMKFRIKKINDKNYIIIVNDWKYKSPESGWNNFISLIRKYKIFSLKSGVSFKHARIDLTHSSYIQFELVQSNKYRFYQYLEPAYFRFVDPGSKDVYDFLKRLNAEMNVKVYDPAEKLFLNP